VRIYDAKLENKQAGKPLKILEGLGGPVFAVAYKPDATVIAVGASDGKVRLFNSTTWELVKEFVAVPLKSAK
jgi:WD40 repeat protein